MKPKLDGNTCLLEVLNSTFEKISVNQPFFMTSFEKNEHFYYDYFPFCSIQEKFLHWKRIENPFKFKLKLPVFRVVLKTPKTSLDKLTITAIKVQQRTIIEKTDAEVDISCLD